MIAREIEIFFTQAKRKNKMSEKKNEFQQTSIDINKVIDKPPVKVVPAVKPTAPNGNGTQTAQQSAQAQPTKEKREPKHYVEGEVLTETDLQKMTITERENYLEEKRLANVEKLKEIRYHSRELKNKYQRVKQNEAPDVEESKEDEYDDFISIDSKKQKNVCKKYRINVRELRKGVEVARRLFVPAMMKTEKQAVVMAICDLLEFGDLPGRIEK